MRKLYARSLLNDIAYDMTLALNNNEDTKKILANAKKRLERIKDNTYYTIDWT